MSTYIQEYFFTEHLLYRETLKDLFFPYNWEIFFHNCNFSREEKHLHLLEKVKDKIIE